MVQALRQKANGILPVCVRMNLAVVVEGLRKANLSVVGEKVYKHNAVPFYQIQIFYRDPETVLNGTSYEHVIQLPGQPEAKKIKKTVDHDVVRMLIFNVEHPDMTVIDRAVVDPTNLKQEDWKLVQSKRYV